MAIMIPMDLIWPFHNLKMIQIQDEVDKVTQQPKKYDTFEFKLDLKSKPEAKLAFVAFYGPSAIFLQSTVKPQWSIGTLNFLKAKQQALANIYFNEGRLYTIFKQDFSNCVQYFLGEFFFDNFKFQRLIVIDWRQQALLETQGQQLKYLKNSAWTQKTLGSLFNGFINGTTASLMVEGELRGVPVIHFIGIMGNYEISRKDVQLYNVLESFDLKPTSDTSGLIKKYNQYKGNGRLYM